MNLPHIRIKLLVLLATLNIAITCLTYVLSLWGFDRSFSRYLEQQNLQRLAPVAASLGELFARYGSWAAVAAEPEALAQTLRRSFGPADPQAGMHPEPGSRPDIAPHLPKRKAALPPGLVILDAEGLTAIGPNVLVSAMARLPIESAGRRVGYLGTLPAPNFALAAADQAFAEQQQHSSALVALALLVASGIGAAGIAHWLGGPIGELARGTRALGKGESGVRIAVRGKDEFSQLAQRFNRLSETLDESRKARQERLADISHELRAPLTVLRGKIDAFEDGVHPATMENIASLRDDLNRLAGSVEDVHLLALADTAPLLHQNLPIALDAVIQRLISGHRHAIEQAGLEVKLALCSNAWVLGDADRIAQLLGNLLHNSLRYTASPGRIEIALVQGGSDVALHWEDSSPGVTDDELACLTRRHYRAGSSAARAPAGTGLGLAIVSSIAESHGARLQASHSRLGGLCWHIEFPLFEGRAAS